MLLIERDLRAVILRNVSWGAGEGLLQKRGRGSETSLRLWGKGAGGSEEREDFARAG